MSLALVQNTENTQAGAVENTWDVFWALYPKKVAKKDALRAWAKVPVGKHVEVLMALVAWRKEWLRRGELQFVPHPATWLNGERWEDEIPVAPTVSSASHVQASVSAPSEKQAIPESVLAVFRTLKR